MRSPFPTSQPAKLHSFWNHEWVRWVAEKWRPGGPLGAEDEGGEGEEDSKEIRCIRKGGGLLGDGRGWGMKWSSWSRPERMPAMPRGRGEGEGQEVVQGMACQ